MLHHVGSKIDGALASRLIVGPGRYAAISLSSPCWSFLSAVEAESVFILKCDGFILSFSNHLHHSLIIGAVEIPLLASITQHPSLPDLPGCFC